MKMSLAEVLMGDFNAMQPQGWAKRVHPMPAFDPFSTDNIFRSPVAPGTQSLDFDKMGYSQDDWARQYIYRANRPKTAF